MDGWQDRLHTSFIGQHVLVTGIQLSSFGSFCSAALVTMAICLAERMLSLAMARQWTPIRSVRRSRLQTALWRSALHWIATFLRLIYMLIAMTFHLGLIITIVRILCSYPLCGNTTNQTHLPTRQATSLSAGQFVIEYLELPETPRNPDKHSYPLHEPLLSSPIPSPSDKSLQYQRHPTSRPRAKSKTKPTDIFIHPNDSNIARADAAAVELGLHGSTERVKAHVYPSVEDDDENAGWTPGKGRNAARELLGSHSRAHESRHDLFGVGENDSDDEV
ncbi:hypothetical protein OF83DRAFT_673976 [Amylostereum chailletii]|nr:hypothetical protein OF83DRAFT_673976 [Amylostereum chailletii]